jgi:hypothetical protein
MPCAFLVVFAGDFGFGRAAARARASATRELVEPDAAVGFDLAGFPERAPKSIVITHVGSPPNAPSAALALSDPIPTSRHAGVSMFSRCPGEASHASIAAPAVTSDVL